MDSGQPERRHNYYFHNPNAPEVTADFLIKLFTEVNLPKAEAAISAALQAPVLTIAGGEAAAGEDE